MIFSRLINYKQSAYTLTELLVVIALIGILTAIGIPTYTRFSQQGQFSQAYNNLYNAYRFARSEAVKTSSTMVLAAIDGAWGNGWEVSLASNSLTLLSAPALESDQLEIDASTLSITNRGTVTASNVTTFTVTDKRTNTVKYICIFQCGQSYQSEVACPL